VTLLHSRDRSAGAQMPRSLNTESAHEKEKTQMLDKRHDTLKQVKSRRKESKTRCLVGIVLYSKHTGDKIHLGSTFKTRDEAKQYIDKNVCLRCNRFEFVSVSENARWLSRHVGFAK
jgi:hypothetical protein